MGLMLTKHPVKILWLDTETTGLDARRNGIVQIAGIFDIDTIPVVEFEYKIRPFPDDIIEDSALEVNGYTRDQLKTLAFPQLTHRLIVERLDQHINRYDKNDKAHIAGQNPSFDRDFLKEWFVKNEDPYFGSWFDYHLIDLCSLSMVFHLRGIMDLVDPSSGRVSVRLSNVARALGLERKEPHDALDDIRLTREIFYEHMIERFF